MFTMCADRYSLTPSTLAISSTDVLVDGSHILTKAMTDPAIVTDGSRILTMDQTDPIATGDACYFEATSTNGQFFSAGSRTTMIYENVYVDMFPGKTDENILGGYNLETGVYSCPLDGRYVVNAVIGFDVTEVEFMLNSFIYINGVEKLQTFFPYGAINNNWLHSGMFQGVVTCHHGDQLEVKAWVSDGPGNGESPGQYTYGVESINRLTIYRLPY